MTYFSNPYTNTNFFSFFKVLFSRILLFLRGNLSFDALASDEIQLLVLAGIALCGAMVGTFLVLRKQTMLANALSHTLLLGIVVVFLISQIGGSWTSSSLISLPMLMLAALFSSLLTTGLTEMFHRVLKLQQDASIGLVFSTLFALGILLVTIFTRNAHMGTELVMGNVDALQKEDLKIVFIAFLFNALLFWLFFKEFVLTTFDPSLAKTLGFSILFFNTLLMLQVSLTMVAAFRAVGVLMVLAFFVLPPITTRFWTHNLPTLIITSMGVGVLASIVGVAFSRHIFTMLGVGCSTGGIVVILLLLSFVVSALCGPRGKLINFLFSLKFQKKKNEINNITP